MPGLMSLLGLEDPAMVAGIARAIVGGERGINIGKLLGLPGQSRYTTPSVEAEEPVRAGSLPASLGGPDVKAGRPLEDVLGVGGPEKESFVGAASDEAKRRWLEEALWGEVLGGGPKRPAAKLRFSEMLAGAIRPQLLPYILQRKMEPYYQEEKERQSRRRLMADMLGLYKPQEPEEFTLGPGQRRYRGPEEIARGPEREEEGFTLGRGQVRYGPGGEIMARGPEAEEAETLPASVVGRFIDAGVNPYPAGDPRRAQVDQVLGARGTKLSEQIEREAREVYRRALNEALSQPYRLKGEDKMAAAADEAAKAMETYISAMRGRGAGGGGGGGDLRERVNARAAELRAAGYSQDVIDRTLEDEFGEEFPEE